MYSNPMIQPEPEGYPLVSVEVLRFNTTAGNPVKKILLKLNLSDHRLFKDGGGGQRPTQAVRECSYSEFLKCKPLVFKGTKGVVGLTRWFEKMEFVLAISNCTHLFQVNIFDLHSTRRCSYNGVEIQEDETEMWNLKVKAPMWWPYNRRYQATSVDSVTRMFPKKCGAQGHFKRNCPKLRNNDRGNQAGNDRAPAKVYVVGNAGANPDNVVAELGSFDAIIGMDWLAKYQAVIVCAEKIVRIPWRNETLIIHGDGIRDFPEVFPEDLPGLPLTRQVEFQIDLVLGAAPNKQEHEEHLKLILELLKKEELYAKFSKCEFWIPKVQFLDHVIDSEGIHVDLAKIESIKDWTSPKSTHTEILPIF
ncbi:putative reverse transcriptase domain-containing protein [Tanacetum coccineum]|uniref:Reverse transcriptase domain-containing protein n=1 Tax=Tanacetum coccineum TaxID=301880 RepID=A0ABQ5HU66_9ASTR